MTDNIIESIFDKIRETREEGYEVNEIKVDNRTRNELLKCDSLVRANNLSVGDTEVGRVCGVDVAVDNAVSGVVYEIEDDSLEFVDVTECTFCRSEMMYDEANDEYYCPLCEK